jgi:hypothetical protein
VKIYSAAADLKSRAVRTMVNWWSALAASGSLPARVDFDPLEFRQIMPHLMIAEPEGRPFRIRYRLVGTKIVEAVGWDFTGTYLDDLLPADQAAPWIGAYRRASDLRLAIYGRADTPIPSGSYEFEFAILPLRLNGQDVEQFIGVEDYFDYQYLGIKFTEWRPKPGPHDK